MPWPKLNDEQAAELAAARDGRVGFLRSDRAVVRATGRHRGRFLNGLLTARVEQDAAGDERRACFCTARGRILAVLDLRVGPEHIDLITAADRVEALVAGLLRYRVAERVQLTPVPDGIVVQGPDGRLRVDADPAATPARWRSEGIRRGSAEVADALDILRGLPRLGRDVDDGSTPLEAGLRDAVSFDKGCYLGQEAIAMMAYRGRLRRHLCHLRAPADATPSPGWILRTPSGERAGRVGGGFVEGGVARGLGMVQRRVFRPGVELLAHPPEGGDPVPVVVLDTTLPGAFEDDPTKESRTGEAAS